VVPGDGSGKIRSSGLRLFDETGERDLTKWPDKVGVVISCLLLYALLVAPFMTFRANRIVQGETRTVFEALPASAAAIITTVVLLAAFIAFFRFSARLKLTIALVRLLLS